MKKFLIPLFTAVLFLASCDDDDPCSGVDCSGHGSCSVKDGDAECTCDEGYFNDGPYYCLKPCDGVDCSGHGSCSPDENNYPICTCEEGYINNGPVECIQTDDE